MAATLTSVVYSFFPGPFFALALLSAVVIIAVWVVALFCQVIYALIKRLWTRSALLVTAVAVACPLAILGALSGDYIHLIALYPKYHSIVSNDPDGQSKAIRFPWGDAAIGVLDGIQLRTLIYDATSLTQDRAGKIWRDQETRLIIYTRHLLGNFFIEDAKSG